MYFREWQHNETKAVEEYCWVITQWRNDLAAAAADQVSVCWILNSCWPVFMHKHIYPTYIESRLDPDLAERNYCLSRGVSQSQSKTRWGFPKLTARYCQYLPSLDSSSHVLLLRCIFWVHFECSIHFFFTCVSTILFLNMNISAYWKVHPAHVYYNIQMKNYCIPVREPAFLFVKMRHCDPYAPKRESSP